MTDEHDRPLRDRLIDALAETDSRVRSDRADRIIWMGQFEKGYAFIGHADTVSVLQEAKDCFVSGHFIATQVLAIAFAEHVLYERLSHRGLYQKRSSLASMVRVARQHAVLPAQLLDEIDRLREIRNPFVHREAGKRTAGLGERVQLEKRHPQRILEQDAQAALTMQFAIFELWLSES